jgi:hypothetical protein
MGLDEARLEDERTVGLTPVVVRRREVLFDELLDTLDRAAVVHLNP